MNTILRSNSKTRAVSIDQPPSPGLTMRARRHGLNQYHSSGDKSRRRGVRRTGNESREAHLLFVARPLLAPAGARVNPVPSDTGATTSAGSKPNRRVLKRDGADRVCIRSTILRDFFTYSAA